MISKKTNPVPDGLPVAGFANLDYDEFDAVDRAATRNSTA